MGKAVARTERPGPDPAAGFDSGLEEIFLWPCPSEVAMGPFVPLSHYQPLSRGC